MDEIHRTLKNGGLCVITTPNLAAWYNRIALFLGYQPFWTNVSLRHNVGKMVEVRNWKETSAAGHIRVFTFRSLRELLTIHRFTIIQTYGVKEEASNNNLYKFIFIINNIFSQFPSLAPQNIYLITKERHGQDAF